MSGGLSLAAVGALVAGLLWFIGSGPEPPPDDSYARTWNWLARRGIPVAVALVVVGLVAAVL